MPYHVTVKTLNAYHEPQATLIIHEGDSLLAASERCFNKSIAVGCRKGGCGVCRVQILSGKYASKVMSKAHVSDDNRQDGIVLACRVFPESDMEIAHVVFKPIKSYLMA